MIILAIFIVISFILSLSPVQTYIAKHGASFVNKQYDTSISVSKVDISVFGKIALEHVLVLDLRKDTLMYFSSLRGNLDKIDLAKGKFIVDDLFLIEPKIHISTYSNDSISNISSFLNKFKSETDTSKIEKKVKFDLSSTQVTVKDLDFEYNNIKTKQQLKLHSLDLFVNDIAVNNTSVNFGIKSLSFISNNGFKMNKFDGEFSYSPDKISIKNLYLETDNSKINSDIKISYPSVKELLSLSENVKIDLSIDKSVISLRDINSFKRVTNSNESVFVTLQAKGNLDNLNVPKFIVKTANKTELNAKLNLTNVLSKKDFNYKIHFNKLSSNYGDIINLIPHKIEKSIPKIVNKLGNFNLRGDLYISLNLINSDLKFVSDIGELNSKLRVVIPDSINASSYTGNIKVVNFRLDSIITNSGLGLAELDLEVDGKGFDINSLNSYIKGNINKLDYRGYRYKKININGNISEKLFKGDVSIDDENLKLSFNGLFDNKSKIPKYAFDIFIDKADLVKTNLFTRDSLAYLEGNIKIELSGETLDDITGYADLSNFVYQNERDLYYFDQLSFISEKKDEKHFISINSEDVIEGEIEGKFYFGDVVKLFKNAIGSSFRKYKLLEVEDNQKMKFNFTFKNKVVDIFLPKLDLKPGTKLKESLNSRTNHLKLKFDSPGIKYDKFNVDSLTLWVDNKNTFFNTLLKVKSFRNEVYPINNLNLAIINKKDSVYISTNFIGGDSLSERYDFKLYQTIDEDNNFIFGFLESNVNYKNNDWKISSNNSKENRLVYNFKSKDFTIDSLSIHHKDHNLVFSGNKSGKKQLYKLDVNNISLSNILSSKSKFKLNGDLDADVILEIDDGVIKPIANLSIDSLVFNSSYLGNLDLVMDKMLNTPVYNTELSLVRYGMKSINTSGTVDLSKDKPMLDLDVNLNKLNLDFVNAFTPNLFNEIGGYASGELKIGGELVNPTIDGFLKLNRASIGVDYTKVKYNIDGAKDVLLKGHTISIPAVTIRDSKFGTEGVLSGVITNSDNFKTWDLNLKVKANKLLALNTTEEDNSTFYGKVFTTGEIDIYGPTSSLNFDITAITEKGSVFSIPLQSVKDAGKTSFIEFVSPDLGLSDEEIRVIKEEKLEKLEDDFFKGLNLSFKLQVTPDALVEIVLDQQVGDVMKARGDGTFSLDIDTKGDFSLSGTYVVLNGDYLFTMENLINKKFTIQQGGTVTWNGDPNEAIINLEAIYKTKTQVASYLDRSVEDGNNKMTVELILKLKGALTKPEISFDIKMPDAEASLQSQLEMKLNEYDEERSRQFIMLITLNSFASATSEISVGSSVAGSTAELFANQLSNMASGISDNFDVNFNYISANAVSDINSVNTNDEFEVGLSSQMFDDRITVNGNVGVPVGSSQSSMVGDVEVLVNITKDGRWKGKVFTRQNVVTDLYMNEGYTQGVGVSYQTNFDTFKEFIKNLFKNKKKDDEFSKISSENKVESKTENKEESKTENESTEAVAKPNGF